jgi:hypothetical protein
MHIPEVDIICKFNAGKRLLECCIICEIIDMTFLAWSYYQVFFGILVFLN